MKTFGKMGILAFSLLAVSVATANTTPQTIPFGPQDWSNAALLSTTDDWSGVPGFTGFRGDSLTAANDVDARTVTASEPTSDVNIDQANPNTFTSGGISEFAIADPAVALAGSATADAPYLVLAIDSTGESNVTVAYRLRDLEDSADNAAQQVALQYRVGGVDPWVNPADVNAYTADATTGPGTFGSDINVTVVLDAAADNSATLEVRWITTNATGADEWVAIDDIEVTSGGGPSEVSNWTIYD